MVVADEDVQDVCSFLQRLQSGSSISAQLLQFAARCALCSIHITTTSCFRLANATSPDPTTCVWQGAEPASFAEAADALSAGRGAAAAAGRAIRLAAACSSGARRRRPAAVPAGHRRRRLAPCAPVQRAAGWRTCGIRRFVNCHNSGPTGTLNVATVANHVWTYPVSVNKSY